MKPKGLKEVVAYYKNLTKGNVIEVYYCKFDETIRCEEFIDRNSWVNFGDRQNDFIVLGFAQKGDMPVNKLEGAILAALDGDFSKF